MARSRRQIELSLDKRFFSKLYLRSRKMRRRRPYIGKDGKSIKVPKGGEKR